MKRILFPLTILILGMFLVAIGIGNRKVTAVGDPIGELIFPPQVIMGASWGRLVNQSGSDTFRALPLGEADTVFFTKSSEVPIFTWWDSGKIILKKGLYLLSLSDPFHDYSVENPDFHIAHLANGAYFVDSRKKEIRIYSLNALLRVDLLGEKGTILTNVNVFPSELFVYDTMAKDGLANADVFRIGQISSLTIADIKEPEDFERIFPEEPEDNEPPRAMLNEYSSFLQNRQKQTQEFIDSFHPKEYQDLTILEEHASWFINDQKRKVLLKNSLIGLMQYAVKVDTGNCDTDCQENLPGSNEALAWKIASRIADLESIEPGSEKTARTLVRRYLSVASMISAKHTQDYFVQWESTAAKVYGKTFGSTDSKVAYRLLSELYAQYFEGMSRPELQRNLTSYVTYLVHSNAMGEREFLGFVYFLKEFLGSNREVDTATTELFAQIISISQKYINTQKTSESQFSVLSVFFYIFTSISDRIGTELQKTYFDTDNSTGNVTLKPEYHSWENSKVPQSLINGLKSVQSEYDDFLAKNGALFTQKIGNDSNEITDSMMRSSESFKRLADTRDIFENYSDYLAKIALGSGELTGISIKEKELTLEYPSQYLSKFAGVDISTLRIVNDFQKDGVYGFQSEGFYRIEVDISGKNFRFTLNPKGNLIQEVIIMDADGENDRFKGTYLSLDDKEKYLKEQMAAAHTAEDRARYDIRNFFTSTFLSTTESGATIQAQTGTTVVEPEFNAQIQLFVQNELIEKDFTFVSEILPISIKNVTASIVNKEYDIRLQNLPMNIRWKSRVYRLQADSKYIFKSDTHAFEDFEFQVLADNLKPLYDWQKIKVLPEQILTVDFVNRFENLGHLLDIVLIHHQPGNSNITIDLSANLVNIDGIQYTE